MATVSSRSGRLTPTPVCLGDLAEAAGATSVSGNVDILIQHVEYDSRKIRPGSLFVALRGGYTDGHRYLDQALANGAVAALVEDPSEAGGFDAVAVVENTRRALSPLGARFYDYPGANLGIVGVTGTDGKTTTSFLIESLLRSANCRTGMIGTVAIRIGQDVLEHDTRQTTPESLEIQRLLFEMIQAGVDWAVLEATSHGLEMHRMDDCPVDIAVVTNVTREHLDFHGSIENYRRAKARLLQRARDGSRREFPRGAVINLDDEGARSIASAAGSLPVVWFSREDPQADVFADEVIPHETGTRFRLKVRGESTQVDLHLLGGYNVLNAMAAAGVGTLLGFNLTQIKQGLESLPHVPGRMQRVRAGQPFNVVVDYAHSPASLDETLRLLRNVTRGKLIAVSGSAGERDRGKRPLQGAISARIADFSVFTSEDPRFEDPELIICEIAKGAEADGNVEGIDFVRIEDRRTAIEHAFRLAGPDDTVVLAGKGHEQCMIYGDQRVPWNDAVEAEKALARLGFTDTNPETEGSA